MPTIFYEQITVMIAKGIIRERKCLLTSYDTSITTSTFNNVFSKILSIPPSRAFQMILLLPTDNFTPL